MQKNNKKYHIITLGCQMNKSDSERMETIFEQMGLFLTDSPQEANVIIINTCSVRQSAEDRVYGMVNNFTKLKKDNPGLIIGVTGCMAGRDKKNVFKNKMPELDLYFPTHEMIFLPERLASLNPELRPGGIEQDYLALRPNYNSAFQAFVTIQTGCNHFCTYCVVPYARGIEGNRPLKQILDEVRDLSDKGYLEITLLGQIVNHYQAPDPEYFSKDNPYKKNDFARLLWEINQLPNIKRVHFTAPHPLYMCDEVIDALTLPKQVNYLHIPVQSGNTEILKKMNRRHDREFFLKVIDKIRVARPGITLGTDLIVGFCGETKAQFEDTVTMYKYCDFDISYTAQYSPRSGTVADKAWADDVSREEKKQRWQQLQELMEKNTLEKNQKYVGENLSVLVEKWEKGWCIGKSEEMKSVRFKAAPSLVGSIQSVTIEKAEEWVLWGKKVED